MAENPTKNPIRIAANAAKGAADKTRNFFSRKSPIADVTDGAVDAASQGGKIRFSMGRPSVTNALGGTNRALGRVASYSSNGVFYGGMLVGLGGMFNKIPFIGKPLKALGEAAQKPDELLTETKVSDISRAGSTALAKAADLSERLKDGNPLAGKLRDASAAVSEREAGLRSVVKDMSHRVTDPFAKVVSTHAGGVLERVSGIFSGRAERQFGGAASSLDDAIAKVGQTEGVGDALREARAALGDGAAKMDGEALTSALQKASEGLDGLADGALDPKIMGALRKQIGKAGSAAGLAMDRQGTAETIGNLPEKIQNAPEAIAGSNLKNAINNGLAVSVTALQTIGTVKGIRGELLALKSLYSDLTGESKISTRKVLFGKDVPEMVKEARGQIFKQYGPQVALNFAAAATNYAFRNNSSTKSKMGGYGLNMLTELHRGMTQDFNLLNLYAGLSQAPGEQMQPEHYAMLLASASKNARQSGGVNSPLVQQLAMDYASEGADVVSVLRDVETGKLDERAKTKFEQMKSDQSPEDALALKDGDAPEREVLGKFTQKVRDEQMQRGEPDRPSPSI